MIEAVLGLAGSIGPEVWMLLAGAVGALVSRWWIRRDAERSAENRLRAAAAAEEQQRRRAGDAAARDAERDGADVRLRRGDF